ncbi:MAG TPA: winged helix-turn-helix domain-containing protein [Candidatus Nitrosotalea sp.]|nr:winged helix-turn-helix domain-containing protein [Candidatus Nitrosotalea sp.]
MSTLLQKEIKVNKTLATNIEQAKALDDYARIRILQILYHKQLSTEQIVGELHKEGYKKATTTIRHHLDVLKEAGLIEIVKMEEIRGAVQKYYGTTVKVLGHKLPPNFENEFSKAITDASVKLEKVIKNIAQTTGPKIKKKNNAKNMAEPGYEEYLLVEIMNRAMTRVFEGNNLQLQK